METPSSMRRATRSQARTKSRQEEAPERSALLDITNDSPVVGLKVGSFADKAATPTSAPPAAKAKAATAAVARTPGSGEALLRKQVKFLLQKVEEETELVVGAPPPPGEQYCPAFRALISHLRSPAQLLAPTPANTPVLKEEDALMCETVLLHHGRHEVEFRSAKEEQEPSGHQVDGAAMITRALQFDSPKKPEACDSPDGSCSSAWSLQVNCSTKLDDEDDDDGEEEVEQVGYYVGEDEEDVEEEEEEEEKEEWFDVLCEGMKKVSLLEEAAGKHTRFVYDSDDEEIAGEEEVKRVSVLKGMPLRQGKHIRFQEEDDEEEQE